MADLNMTSRRHCLQAFAALGLAMALRPLRAEVGFETLEWDWQDTARQRSVPVRLYLPSQASAAQAVPLVVFSHGIGGSRRGYSYLGEHFASHGVASLHVQHVGSDRQVWTGGSLFNVIGRLQAAAQDVEALARVQDLRFALDRLLAGELAPRFDRRRLVVAGHSYGANTALLAAGAQVQRDGRTLQLRDERFNAAILISAPPFYGEDDVGGILGGVQLPTLHVTATEDVIRIPGYYSGAQDRVRLFEATASAHKWLAVFTGGSHSMFTDRAGTGGALLNPQVKQATKELALAFVQATLEGTPASIEAWPRKHAALLSRFEAR
jgi:pimeloyl-ACP methyl ester carboxylesterase